MIRRIKSLEFLQSLAWLFQGIFRYDKNNENLLDRFEETYQDYDVDPDAEPINILCLDAGAMRGYALSVILSVIEEMYSKNGEVNILEYFDLIAGVSIGGALAISCNMMKNILPAIVEMVDTTDEWREKVNGNLCIIELLSTGALVPEKYQIEAIMQERWGKTKPLSNPHGPPAMALCAMKYDSSAIEGRDEERASHYEPFIVRTYEYPSKSSKETRVGRRNLPLCDSTSSIEMYKAVAATTAVPGLAGRVKTKIDGKDASLADGAQFAMCPITVALDEARRLYPQRPLGVILSLGMDDKDRPIVERAVKAAKISSPQLHFQRIAPLTNFPLFEMDWEKLMLMEERIRDHILIDEKTKTELDKTMKLLLSQRPRIKLKYVVEPGSLEDTRHKMNLKSETIEKRMSCRSSWASHMERMTGEQLKNDIESNLDEYGEESEGAFGSANRTNKYCTKLIDKAKNLHLDPTQDKKEPKSYSCKESANTGSANTHSELMSSNESDIIGYPGNPIEKVFCDGAMKQECEEIAGKQKDIKSRCNEIEVCDLSECIPLCKSSEMILMSGRNAPCSSQSTPAENDTPREINAFDPESGNDEHTDNISIPLQPTLRDLYVFALPCLCIVVCNPLLSLVDTASAGITSKSGIGTVAILLISWALLWA